MSERKRTVRLAVEGMSCSTCERRIEKAVRALGGVSGVRASSSLGEVKVTCDAERVDRPAIEAAIQAAGYQVRTDPAASRGSILWFLGLLAVMAAVYLIIRSTVGFTFLPSVTQNMGYGLIFVVGLLTSLHCVAMCGGIVLSQGIRRNNPEQPEPTAPTGLDQRRSLGERLRPNLLYNGGRVVSYTIIGGLVGALGSVLSLSTTLKGILPVAAGVFMLFLGIRMLGIFPWLSRLKLAIPGIPSGRLGAAAARRGPFVVGLLNGLMPCGPLQTMQIYALGTGSFLAGALSMFLFSVGTVPLLLGLGAVSSLLSARFNRRMVQASGVLVLALGLLMFTRGLNLFGVSFPNPPAVAVGLTAPTGVAVARVAGAYQEVRTTVEANAYHPFVVQVGIPVRWTVSVKAADLNGCNSPLTVPELGIRKELVPGDNLIEFTPDHAGTIVYTCWMGMITSSIQVVGNVAKGSASDGATTDRAPPADIASAFASGSSATSAGASCCGGTVSARFVGGAIPTDPIGIAKVRGDTQVVEIAVNDAGYTPAVVVLQRGIKAKIRFSPRNLSACNSVVTFPEYQGSIDLQNGELETPYLDVTQDFGFQCGMGMLHGYVRVVDDINHVNLDQVRTVVAAYRPASSGGASCCGR